MQRLNPANALHGGKPFQGLKRPNLHGRDGVEVERPGVKERGSTRAFEGHMVVVGG